MDVFVYGTLTDPEQVGRLLDSFVFVGPATLDGLHAVDGKYPTLAPGGRTAGRLLRTEAIHALDEYEHVADGLYTRVTVPLEGGSPHPDDADVYVGNPTRLNVSDDVDWPAVDVDEPGNDDFAARVRNYVAREDVSIAVERES